MTRGSGSLKLTTISVWASTSGGSVARTLEQGQRAGRACLKAERGVRWEGAAGDAPEIVVPCCKIAAFFGAAGEEGEAAQAGERSCLRCTQLGALWPGAPSVSERAPCLAALQRYRPWGRGRVGVYCHSRAFCFLQYNPLRHSPGRGRSIRPPRARRAGTLSASA